MTTFAQRNFAGGEISPSLYARTDIVKYQTGLRTCRNFLIQKHGGATNDSGTQFIAEVKTSADETRLIPFIFNTSQTYALEFGDGYMRVIRNGAAVEVSGVSAYNAGTAYVIGDLCSSGGVNYYCIADTTGNAPPNVTYWYALTGDIYEIPTPYAKADLFNLQFIQSADVVTIVHPTYPPKELSRTAHTTWILSTISFAPSQVAPTNVSVAGSAGALSFTYHVTAVKEETYEESLAATDTTASLAEASSSNPHTITWTAASGALQYNIYKVVNGVPSFVGIAIGTSFSNNGITPDTSDSPPVARNPFSGADNYPSVVAYIQQRLTFSNTNNDPEKTLMSRSAQYKNFTNTTNLAYNEAVTFTVVGKQVNSVKHIVDIGKMVMLTASGEWEISGDDAGIISPVSVNPKQISYYGSSEIAPIIIGSSIIFIQSRKNVIRDLYEDVIEGNIGSDLTIFAAHLFEGHTIVSWAYQQIPNSIIWAVRDDGVLLGFTYLRDHKVWAWHKHDTDGLYEDVISIPEGNEDVLYFVIKRTIDGSDVRYIERSYTRVIDDVIDNVFLHSALSYDGRNTSDSHTMTLTGSGWTYTDTLTLTSSASFFSAGDVGNEIHLTGSDDTVIRCEITAYTSVTEVSVLPHKTVPVIMQAVAISEWGKAVDSISGLGHLEGEDIGVFADRFVVASPNNDSYETITVASATATLDKPYVVIHAGLPYISDFQTLDIDNLQGETYADKKKLITNVSLFVEKTRGVFGGGKPPSDDDVDPLQGLYELKIRELEGYNDPVSLTTGIVDIKMENTWNQNGRVFIRQVDPIPVSILAAYPSGLISAKR